MSRATRNFALIGAAGFVAPRHMQAIRSSGHRLVAACDLHDAVGILDSHGFAIDFFTNVEDFAAYLVQCRQGPPARHIDYVTICSPNDLHLSQIRLALSSGANVICEKPLVLEERHLDTVQEWEALYGQKVYTVLQLRLNPLVRQLRSTVAQAASNSGVVRQVELTYITARGCWYDVSWKGSQQRSGGLALNIGIHFFDLLTWLFGSCTHVEVHRKEPRRMAGVLHFPQARVRWYLSVEASDLPAAQVAAGQTTYRSMVVDGEAIDLTAGFTEAHTRVYEDIFSGGGYGVAEARPGIALVERINGASVESRSHEALSL